MLLQKTASLIVRFSLLTVLLAGMYATVPMQASAREQNAPTCALGQNWMWVSGYAEPDIARQVQQKLVVRGIQASVEATGYGEMDNCGSYEPRGVDFTIQLEEPYQPGMEEEVLPILTAHARPALGDVKLLSSAGTPIPVELHDTIFDLEPPAAAMELGALSGDPITRRVYVIAFDPLLSNGQTLTQYKSWNSHAMLTQQTVDFFKQATNNKMNYDVVETTVVTSGWPQLVDGFTYTEAEYLAVLTDPDSHHEPTGVDYNHIVNSPEFDICGKANRGEIDEVWIYNGPWFGFYESTLVGPGAYYYNSGPVPGPHNCNRLIPIMGPSPERGPSEAVHNFGHRAESTMAKVYGSWQQNSTSHSWNKFGLVKAQSPSYSYSGCGSVHYPPNATSDYDYSNGSSALTNCDDFLNYPDLRDPLQVAQPVTCSAWGCTQLGFLSYWFGHFPSFVGCGPDNVSNDWWKYLASPANALDPSRACQEDMHWISGNVGAPNVTVSYVDGTPKTVLTDAYGNYSLLVSNHWSGSITPSRANYVFTPASLSYVDVLGDLYEQNYAAEGGGPATYFVDFASGDNANACTLKTAPCRNIQEAINKAAAGDIVKVTSGDYTFSSNPTPNVVIVNKNITLSGGWTSDFSSQSGASTIDGGNVNNGILVISGAVTVENFIVENSRSSNSGAVYIVNGNFTLKRSTLRNNVATGNGGGVFLDNGSLTVVNSTISGNTAMAAGGGIYASLNSGTSVTIQNSTIAHNHAGQGGGIRRTNGTYNITNTIIADNSASTSGADCSGMIAQASHSLIEDMAGCTISSGSDNLSVDPQLDASLSGPGLVHVPLAGSPVIDAGTSSGCPTTDQLGTSRPQGSGCDIGSVELPPLMPSRTPTFTATYTPTVTRTVTPSRTPTLTPTPDGPSRFYVDKDAAGANNGTSWTDAYTDLQIALAAASSGDEIWVATGAYKPTGGTDRTISFVLKNGVAIYGGFAGHEATLEERDSCLCQTTLSGDIGVTGDTSDNSYHVVVGSNTDNSAILDRFTVTAGNANQNQLDKGGGMLNIFGSPTIRDVIFEGNTAGLGGGMYNGGSSGMPVGSNPVLSDVTFRNNQALEGGGMENQFYSSPSLSNVVFRDNAAERSGGGMLNYDHSSPALTNVIFDGNSAAWGGGMANWIGDDPTLHDVTFEGNTAEWGGGLGNYQSSPILSNLTFTANSATTFGGAISNEHSSAPNLLNVTLQGNSAVTYGGGVFQDGTGSATLTHVTISGNTAASQGGGVYNQGGSFEIRNSILYGNTGGEIEGPALVSHSIVQGGYPGAGNLDADPMLGQLQNHGGSLSTMELGEGSPAIDAAHDTICPARDARGIPRPQDSHCDMGAFEYRHEIHRVKGDATGADDGTSWADAFTDLQDALAASLYGDELWVAAGTYYPTSGTDHRISFDLRNGVEMYGGFAGIETARDQRDLETNVTVLSGDIGSTGDNSDNSYHVVFGGRRGPLGVYTGGPTIIDTFTVLDGFTITAGNANGLTPENLGGGMFIAVCEPSLTNIIFIGNQAKDGGGLYAIQGIPRLTGVTFSNNVAEENGGGFAGIASEAIMTDITFIMNSARYGGGIRLIQSEPVLTNVTMFGNSAAMQGGAIHNIQSDPVLTNVTLVGNIAGSQGGGLYNLLSSPIVRNSILWNNSATLGAQIFEDFLGTPLVSDSVVQGHYGSADPRLGLPGNYGGFTETIPLLEGSSAIDTGNVMYCPATDQRGVVRPQGAGCDIGAYEAEGTIISTDTPSITPTPTQTHTATVTSTSTITRTPTFTATNTGTQTVTSTATATVTYTPTHTLTNTSTATPTRTPTLAPVAKPGIPVLLLPANGAVVDSLSPVLDWKDSNPAAHHYQVQLSNNNKFTALVLDQTDILDSTFTPPADLAAGELYYWRVRAFNGNGVASGWSSVRSFKTPLAQPTLVSPAAEESLLTDRPSFEWGAVDGATQYTLQVSPVETFKTLLVNATVSTAEYSISKDLPGNKTLFWRVLARSASVTGPWSGTGEFSTGNPPSVPVLSAPANSVLVKDYTPFFNWKDATGATVLHYEIEVDQDKAFSDPLIEATTAISEYTPLTALSSNTRYYWRVRAVGTNGHLSGWSPVWSLRTVIAAPTSLTMLPNDLQPQRPSFAWDAATGPEAVKSYTLQISTSASFRTLLVNVTVQDPTCAMPKDLPRGTTLHWRIRINGTNGPSAWSTEQFSIP